MGPAPTPCPTRRAQYQAPGAQRPQPEEDRCARACRPPSWLPITHSRSRVSSWHAGSNSCRSRRRRAPGPPGMPTCSASRSSTSSCSTTSRTRSSTRFRPPSRGSRRSRRCSARRTPHPAPVPVPLLRTRSVRPSPGLTRRRRAAQMTTLSRARRTTVCAPPPPPIPRGCRAVGLLGCWGVSGECQGSVGFTKALKALELAASLVSHAQAGLQ